MMIIIDSCTFLETEEQYIQPLKERKKAPC